MKKFTIIFSIFFFLSFSINTMTAIAQPPSQTFSQGIYTLSNLKLIPNVAYTVQNVSPVETFMLIFDSNKKIQQSIRLEGNSIKYVIRPMQIGYNIVIFGTGQLAFSPTNIIP